MGLHVKYQFACQNVMKLEFYGEIFEKYSNIKFHENPPVQWELSCYMRTDGRTDMTKLIVSEFCESA